MRTRRAHWHHTQHVSMKQVVSRVKTLAMTTAHRFRGAEHVLECHAALCHVQYRCNNVLRDHVAALELVVGLLRLDWHNSTFATRCPMIVGVVPACIHM